MSLGSARYDPLTMHHTPAVPLAYRRLVENLPAGRALIEAADEDLADPAPGLTPEAVADWWCVVLLAYGGTPTPEVARRILEGER